LEAPFQAASCSKFKEKFNDCTSFIKSLLEILSQAHFLSCNQMSLYVLWQYFALSKTTRKQLNQNRSKSSKAELPNIDVFPIYDNLKTDFVFDLG